MRTKRISRGVGMLATVGVGLLETGPQGGDGRVDLATLALLQDDPEQLPHVFLRLEVIAPVAEDVRHPHDAPPLQLLQTDADVGPGDAQGLDDLVGVERIRREK
jgi:hypothetical protein